MVYQINLYDVGVFSPMETFFFEQFPDLNEMLLFLIDYINQNFSGNILQIVEHTKNFSPRANTGLIEFEVQIEKEEGVTFWLLHAHIRGVKISPLQKIEAYLTNENAEIRRFAKEIAQKEQQNGKG